MNRVPQRLLRLLRRDRLPDFRGHFLSSELGHPETGADWWRDFDSKNPLRYQDLKKIADTLAQAHGLR